MNTSIYNHHAFKEQMAHIRSTIEITSESNNVNTLVVTSPLMSEGKSTISIGLALSCSLKKKKTLLIDCDLRRPTIHQKLNLNNIEGLVDILEGHKEFQDCINSSLFDNLDILTSGLVPAHPGELLGSEAMRTFMKMIKKKYDFIVIDTPPILVASETRMIANMCDSTILVVKYNQSKMKDVEKAKELITNTSTSLLGMVLNQFNTKNIDTYY
ncbi:capsular exopolysaccharide family protein [Bacillus cereus VD196]|uniref:non-specific protein-tyrosine kinase n=1 Tax=Bacillus cereus VD196 TaxID=1053243 RepID=A0A9W5PYG7_BACCE|nr:CpsD/CapB family tyrosine-protein kinase [Bacillus cereus]EJR93396.1 capsular exopolysaccharide family protein [Bacillus cereus VD200]EOO61613.1 capsular exopolysaccharide family protein [Bacillus cereus VD196]